MAALTAPKVGEAYLDNAVRFQKISWGASTADLEATGSCVDSDTPFDVALFEYGPGGIMVLGVGTHIDSVFSAETDISVGGTDTDGWVDVENVNATLAGAGYFNSNFAGSATTCFSQYYSTASGAINLTYTAGAAADTVSGIITVGIWYTYGI